MGGVAGRSVSGMYPVTQVGPLLILAGCTGNKRWKQPADRFERDKSFRATLAEPVYFFGDDCCCVMYQAIQVVCLHAEQW